MTTTSRPAIAVLATSKYRAECLALSISVHSEHDTCPLTETESSVFRRFSKILLDLDADLESVLKLVRDTTVRHPDAAVVVVGLVESEEDVMKLAEAGASGYIPANASLQDMLSIIHSARQGEFACPSDVTYSLFSRLAELARSQDVKFCQVAGITIRERQVMELVAQNLSNREIADRLCVSAYTVKNHVHHVLRKLGVRSRSAAVRLSQLR
jgi:DNA-binding NarL/FixJ family response regulator